MSLGKLSIALLSVLLSVLFFSIACSSDSEETPAPLARPGEEIPEAITITIGALTDQTGISSSALQYIDMALEDTVNYYNEKNLIPGVKLEIVKYDTVYDTSKFLTGYEYLLKKKGADVIINFLPPGVPILKSRADRDEMPVFTMTANVEPGELDGSYMYCLALSPTYEAYTFLNWIADNDPDFPEDRPALIGGAAYTEGYSDILFGAAEEYCKAHPDQYKWVEDYQSDFKMIWDFELEGLKDCDYIFTPSPPMSFVKSYREAGYDAKILWTEIHTVFTGMFDKDKLDLWDEMDGSYFLLTSGWYNDDNDPVIETVNKVLEEAHSESEAEKIRNSGGSYRTVMRAGMICEIIKETVERVGAENFSSEALAETANSWSFSYGDIEDFCTFTDTKRFSQNYYVVFEVEVDPSNPHSWQYITRASPDPIPQVTDPHG